MSELLPVLLGATVGATIARARPALFAAAGAIAGMLASAANGELGASWAFVAIDAATASVSALAARAIVDRHQLARRSHG